jgi:hypothetical protein
LDYYACYCYLRDLSNPNPQEEAFHEPAIYASPRLSNQTSRTSRATATPISRPVFMLTHSFNLNPVIDARSR